MTETRPPQPKRRITAAEAFDKLTDSERFAAVFRHGTLSVELYAPRGHDPQQPHTRDEVYVVVSGSGTFVHGDERDPFVPGDFLFVPAGLDHRFEDFTDDFGTWVLFYGPEGGEVDE